MIFKKINWSYFLKIIQICLLIKSHLIMLSAVYMKSAVYMNKRDEIKRLSVKLGHP